MEPMLATIAHIDTSVLLFLYHMRTPFLNASFAGVTTLGNAVTITLFSALLFLIHIIRNHSTRAVGFLTAISGTALTVVALKYLVMRARPDIAFWAVPEVGYSFPSAHAALALMFYGFLIWIVRRSRRIHKSTKNVLSVYFGLVILLVGVSRVYLGVHYLSDVLAGYAIGALFLAVAIRISTKLRDSGSRR